MSIQRPLFWYQGLFLQPQHLQLLERSLQTLLVPNAPKDPAALSAGAALKRKALAFGRRLVGKGLGIRS